MRLNDREITDRAQILDILTKCQIGHLGLVDEEGVYVLPMSFAVEEVGDQVIIWCHGADGGRKFAALQAKPRVCFEAETCHQIFAAETICQSVVDYESFIGFGQAEIIDDPIQARRGMGLVVKAYVPGRESELPAQLPAGMIVFRIVLDQFSGKRWQLPESLK